ncbi:MAG: ComF family protein [Acinetobacter sp.]|nr:ComF family protein [Acinetobacter sp.]
MARFKPLAKIEPFWRRWLQQSLPCMLCQSDTSQYAGLCRHCWQHLPWALTQIQRQNLTIHIACYYRYPLDGMMLQYKYHQQLGYASLFAQLILQLPLPKVDAIVAMPISDARLAERGFNQSLVVVQRLAKVLKCPVWQPIERIHAHHQKGLSRSERLADIDQQFRIIKQQKRWAKRYRRVLVIDDVVTTGASLWALSQALQKMGCSHIEYACIAGAML